MSIVDEIRKGLNLGRQIGAGVERNTRKSIARGANDATIQFPCLMSKSISVDKANSLLRMLDATYAGFVQTYFSMNSTIDISVDPTPAHYLRKYHQNLSLESVGEATEDGWTGIFVNSDKTLALVFEATDKYVGERLRGNAEAIRYYLEDFDFTPFPGDEIAVREARESDYPELTDDMKATMATVLASKVAEKDEKRENDRVKLASDISGKLTTPQMTKQDIKRLNDMVPYGVEIKLMAINGDQQFVNYMSFIVGVKAVLHPIDTDDMLENITKTLTTSSPVFNFIRWTTGEISFFKDFLFNIKSIRDDISGRASTGNPYFAALRRAKNARVNVSHLGVKKMIPNATIVITESEAAYIRNRGYDLTNPRIAKILISKLFLMTFIIVDEASRTVSILYDGSDDFQIYSIEALEKDVAMNSSKLSKEIGKMLSY